MLARDCGFTGLNLNISLTERIQRRCFSTSVYLTCYISLFRWLGQVGEEGRTKANIPAVPNQDLTHHVSRVGVASVLQNKPEYGRESGGVGEGVSFWISHLMVRKVSLHKDNIKKVDSTRRKSIYSSKRWIFTYTHQQMKR